jgi:hypothetical protein
MAVKFGVTARFKRNKEGLVIFPFKNFTPAFVNIFL